MTKKFINISYSDCLILVGIITSIVTYSYGQSVEFLYTSPLLISKIFFNLLTITISITLIFSFFGLGVFFLKIQKKESSFLSLNCLFGIGITGLFNFYIGVNELLFKEIIISSLFFGLFFLYMNNREKKNGSFSIDIFYFVGLIIILGKIVATLNFHSYGDPLQYSLPITRYYLEQHKIQWFDFLEEPTSLGIFEFATIIVPAITENRMLHQLVVQNLLYFLSLIILFDCSKIIYGNNIKAPHYAFILIFTSTQYFNLEMHVAKPDYLIGCLSTLILTILYNFKKNKYFFLVYFAFLSFSIKSTSLFHLIPIGVIVIYLEKFNFLKILLNSYKALLLFLPILIFHFHKNYLLSGNPFFPSDLFGFENTYWKDGIEGVRTNMGFGTGDYYDYAIHFISIITGFISAMIFFLFRIGDQKRFLVEKFIFIFVFFILWTNLIKPGIQDRFFIGAYFGLAFYIIISSKDYIFNRYLKIAIIIGFIGGSYIDLNYRYLSDYISGSSIYENWKKNETSLVIDYLNKNIPRDSLVWFLFSDSKQHAFFKMTATRPHSPRTGFIYTDNYENIINKLRDSKVNYFAIENYAFEKFKELEKLKNLSRIFYSDKNYTVLKL